MAFAEKQFENICHSTRKNEIIQLRINNTFQETA